MVYDDPYVFGPETWRRIHQAARNKTLIEFIKYFVLETDRLPCMVCRKHAKKYLRSHPFDTYRDELGPFRYTWEMHNIVNQRLGKPLLSFEQALALYPKTNKVITPRPTLYPVVKLKKRPTVLPRN